MNMINSAGEKTEVPDLSYTEVLYLLVRAVELAGGTLAISLELSRQTARRALVIEMVGETMHLAVSKDAD